MIQHLLYNTKIDKMRKNLFALGLLALSFSLNGQILTYVGDGGLVYVSSNTLVYSGGTVQTVGTGKIDNSGNVMIDQGGGFYTKAADGTTDKAESDTHANFILRLTDKANYSSYGQLWIQSADQSLIKGYVDKEYLDNDHGSYQQIALPFSQKTLNTLSSELGFSVSNARWSQNELLVYNNGMVRSDNIARMNKTPYDNIVVNSHENNLGAKFRTKPYSYYMIGGASFAADTPTSGDVFTIHGVPFASGQSTTMAAAGASLNFGKDGFGTNYYREWYNTYLQDSWAVASGQEWTGNYGKNIYQYGNPFFTNLDFSEIHMDDGTTASDNTTISNIVGVRYQPVGYETALLSNGRNTDQVYTLSSSAYYITFTSGVATGDVAAVIKPMQAFVIKLNDANSASIDFDNLRRFNSKPRTYGEEYSVTAAKVSGTKASKTTAKVSSSTVKQVGVIALDADGNEIGRTYYVVYQNGVTGQPTAVSTQVAAAGSNIIGTFEESVDGGIDTNLENTYWLYINEANEVDFKGKEIPLNIYSDAVKSLKFEIRENAKLLDSGSNLLNGESFYVLDPSNGKPVAVAQGDVVDINSTQLGLYYGEPINGQVLDVVKEVSKPSETVVVYDESENNYKVLFDPAWSKADVSVHDMSGKLILDAKDINTENNYTLSLPNIKSVFVVTAISETGQKFVQRIKK